MLPSPPDPERILVVRRDNIGDLLCTTPLICALRNRFPSAWLGALVNSYNAPVLVGNPHLDAVFAYDKGKHLAGLGEKLRAIAKRVLMIRQLRKLRIDVAVLPVADASALRFARLSGAQRIVAPSPELNQNLHEVERTFRCAAEFAIEGPPLPMTLVPDPQRVNTLIAQVPPGPGPLIGLHISARKPSQRWPIECIASFAQRLHERNGARFLVFWAPGNAADPRHPGDDEKAAALMAMLADLPAAAIATHRLEELIAGLSLCDRVVMSDGGAMHIAAALGKPLVCFFGNSDTVRWRPWGVPYQLLQAPSHEVADLSVNEVLAAYENLGPTV
jgi:heptosyltransferase III